MNKSIFTFFIFIVSFSFSLSAQKITVSYYYSEKVVNPLLASLFSKNEFKDSLSLHRYLLEKCQNAQEKGFLEISVDSVVYRAPKTNVYIYVGQFYKKIKIRYNNKYEVILSQINSRYLSSDFINTNFIETENEKIINYLENNAYPFSKVYLDSINFEDGIISAYLNIDRGIRILYDSVQISGDLRVSKSFLYGYLGIKPKHIYRSDRVENIQKNINNLPFARQNKNTEISYRDEKLNINIPANSLKNNRFDGILGILPNDKTTGKMVLTGEVNIFLQNMLRSAEEFNFNWQKLESTSQKLLANFKIPYIFNTKLGTSASIDLLKQDSTYLNSTLGAGLEFYFKGQNNIGIHYKSKTSSILSKDTILKTQFKPYRINSTGLVLLYRQLDYLFNPHKGIDVEISASIGRKEHNDYVNSSESAFVQYDAISSLKYFIPIKKRHTILFSNKTAFLVSESLYLNELYRIGGLKSVRGFSEASIYASSYSIMSLEYRFIFEKNSALFTFFDLAWYEKKVQGQAYYYDYPFGFGFGLYFKTKAGVFTISYAMGQQRNEQINIKNAKIHFGFINRF